jgi:hypothetical protein
VAILLEEVAVEVLGSTVLALLVLVVQVEVLMVLRVMGAANQALKMGIPVRQILVEVVELMILGMVLDMVVVVLVG